MRLVECVPNFSEGKDGRRIDAIVRAISQLGVRVLHVDSGESANRTVVTFVGQPNQVEAAAFEGVREASAQIDMRSHTGTHPRMGATDVCPFIPIGDTALEDCVLISERVGERVGRELKIPVYLYAESAKSESRVRLPDIRRGQYEGLGARIDDPEFQPDYGPVALNAKSGATAIGGRRFLIAWNVNLDTKDVFIAKEIARRLRTSGRWNPGSARIPGRFQALQGDGWYIEDFDKVQVTFNILDHGRTPIARVYEACKEEAATLGASVTGSELVGLVPGDALLDAGRFYANLTGSDAGDPLMLAAEHLGLNELSPFDPKSRVVELAYETLAGST